MMTKIFLVAAFLLLFGGLAFGQNPETAVFPDALVTDIDGGKDQTVPSNGYILIKILDDQGS